MEILGKRLKWLRNNERYSQKEIANKIGMTPSGYQKIENDERDPKLDVLVKLCEILNVSADFLLGRNDNTKEIQRLREDYFSLKEKMSMHNAELAAMKKRVLDLKNVLKVVDKDDLNKGSLEKAIEDHTRDLDYITHKFHEVKIVHDKVLFDYILELYKLPHSKPDEDTIIKNYLPLEVVLEEYGDKNYKIRLRSLNGTDIGLLAMSQGQNKEEIYNDIMLKLEQYKELFKIKQ